jgi:transposase
MQDVADQSAAPTTIGADLCAIFISLELSRSTWLATSLSPGRGEKMSKHSVPAGDIAALQARFSELRRKACARTGKSFPIIVIQEAGLDGFWIHRVLLSEGIESHVVDAASIATSRRRRRAKTDRIDGETLLRALLAHKRGEPRVCSMVRAPTPEDEDRRRICRERKVLIMERVQHVNRIKGLLFSQGASGYEPFASRSAGAAGSASDWRWPSIAPTSQSPGVSRTRSARIAPRADQGCGGRAGHAAHTTNQSVGPAADVAGCPWHWA